MLCDRDNLSPLKEFRDISSRVLSVAKTGLVGNALTTEEAPLPRPHSAPPTGQTRKNQAARKKRTAEADRNYHLVQGRSVLPQLIATEFLRVRRRRATWRTSGHANATLVASAVRTSTTIS